MENSNIEGTEVIQALGRPFQLGMLYNAYSDTIVPGLTLWSREKLDSDIDTNEHPYTDFDVQVENSFQNKIEALEAKGQLKLSLMLGLAEIGGFAKYMNETQTSEKVARVTLRYKSTTRFDQLLDHTSPENIERSENLDIDYATHVVVGITYGMKAFIVFEQETTGKSETDEIKGKLKAEIDTFTNSGKAKVGSSAKTEDSDEISKVKCKVFCDCQLESNPTTFEEAIEFYRSLPSFLEGENKVKAVPQEVYLLPLTFLSGDALPAKLRNEAPKLNIEAFTTFLENVISYLDSCLSVIDEIFEDEISQNFEHMYRRLRKFKQNVKKYKDDLINLCKQIVPLSRRSNNNSDLEKIVEDHNKSPFLEDVLEKWINEYRDEVAILKGFAERLSSDDEESFRTTHGELANILIRSNKVVCLELRIEYDGDDILNMMDKFLFEPDNSELLNLDNYQKDAWYKEIWRNINSKVIDFVDFRNKTEDDYKFIVNVIAPNQSNEEHNIGASILYYKDAVMIKKGLPEPEKPAVVEKPKSKSSFCNLL
ncbi:unnamed protein product [Dimorphilus gyrociliatus]|uniref:Uncharacterized protein n=1 Tax=Dimorphilus gyrociliatus TaxID=2664684 RepID=A0A7I8VNC5_9ANNE|nr:unnamed protein product [Dimorphilus gyrociliatus]